MIKKLSPLSVLFLIVFVIYLAVATRFTFQPRWAADYFNPLAKSIVNGKWYIEDPSYIYDLVEFNHHWYLPWGPIVAFILIPLQAIARGNYIAPLYISVLFASLNVVIFYLLLTRVRKDFFPTVSPSDTFFILALFIFGSTNFYLGTQGGVWHVDQMVSSVFGTLGLYIIFKKTRTLQDYFFSVLSLAMTLIGRATIVLLVIVPAVLFLKQYLIPKLYSKQLWVNIVRGIVIFGLPLILFTALFFLYNIVRFHTPFEYGYNYLHESLELELMRKTNGIMSLVNMKRNVWFMLFELPGVSRANGLHFVYNLQGNSIFFLMPTLFFIFFATPIEKRHGRWQINWYITALWSGTILTLIPSLLIYSTGFLQLGYRYSHDVTVLFILLTLFGIKGRLSKLYKASIIVSILMYSLGVWRFV